MGNYTAAKSLLEEAKQRDPKLSIEQPLANARKTASQSLLWEAERRIVASQTSSGAFDRAAYLEEANFLVRRAHSINPDLNLNQELQQVKEQSQKSAKTLKAPPKP